MTTTIYFDKITYESLESYTQVITITQLQNKKKKRYQFVNTKAEGAYGKIIKSVAKSSDNVIAILY